MSSTDFINLAYYLSVKYAIKDKRMADKQSALDAINSLQQHAEEGAAASYEFAARISAIDASASDASAQLETIKNERKQWVTQYNAKVDSIVSTINSEIESLSSADALDVKQQREDTENFIKEQLVVPATAAVRSARTNKESEIKAASQTSITNASASDSETQKKYESSQVVTVSTNSQEETTTSVVDRTPNTTDIQRNAPAPLGAMPSLLTPASVSFTSMSGKQMPRDTRVKIRVPESYFTKLTQGPKNILKNLKGVVFPYTPTLNMESKAEYTTQNLLHSNFSIYFYKNSSISPFNISGKFTVSNEDEAQIYVATIHLLRSLTKMRSGGPTGDFDSGAPPPVCRLDAYGTFMLDNVPVVINYFRVDLPDNVDYFTLGKTGSSGVNPEYESTAVPIVSTISVGCLPVYSRNEMQKFSVTSWLNDKNVKKAGYL